MLHCTYHRPLPAIVQAQWLALNPGLDWRFSNDDDCQRLLQAFGPGLPALFETTVRGCNKADLWRLACLLVHGGVYADVDIVPQVPMSEFLDPQCTFQSALSVHRDTVFQAVLAAPAQSALIASCLLHLVQSPDLNGPQDIQPTYNMYRCLKSSLGLSTLRPHETYRSDTTILQYHLPPTDAPFVHNLCWAYIYPGQKARVLLQFPWRIRQAVLPDAGPDWSTRISAGSCVVVSSRTGASRSPAMRLDVHLDDAQVVRLWQEQQDGKTFADYYVHTPDRAILRCRTTDYVSKRGPWAHRTGGADQG